MDLTDDAIAGGMRVFQRRSGHRYSLDDELTALEAATGEERAGRAPATLCDLGSGIGSVLTMLAYRFPQARITGVEAQEESFALNERNVARNGLGGRVDLFHGDIRDDAILDRLPGPFELVTGTPPYFPLGRGTLSPNSQRAHARMELRGGVEAYLRAAARVLAPGGRFVVCADARTPHRTHAGAAAVGLVPRRRLDVVPREGRGPIFHVWTLGREPGPLEVPEPFVARDAAGARTDAYQAVRFYFGLDRDRA